MSYPNPSITVSGTTFAQFQNGGLSAILENLITVNLGPTAAPTVAPTLAASGSAGTLAATNYFVVITESNGIGETTASPVSSGQAITGTQSIVVTPAALKTGNVSRNAYVGTSNTGPWKLAASGQTGSTITISSLPTNSYAVIPPTVNSTGLTYKESNGNIQNLTLQNIRAAKDGNLQTVFNDAARTIGEWNHGAPMSSRGFTQSLRHSHVPIAFIAQALAEAGTLVDANPGTIRAIQTGAQTSGMLRSWP